MDLFPIIGNNCETNPVGSWNIIYIKWPEYSELCSMHLTMQGNSKLEAIDKAFKKNSPSPKMCSKPFSLHSPWACQKVCTRMCVNVKFSLKRDDKMCAKVLALCFFFVF